jgi:hypothetical protein
MKIKPIYDPKVNPTRVVTGVVRGIYPVLFEPEYQTEKGQPKVDDGKFYSITIIIDDEDTLKAIQAVEEYLIVNDHNGKRRNLSSSLHPGEDRLPEEDDPDWKWEQYEKLYKGKHYMYLKSSERFAPDVMRTDGRTKVESHSEIKSGDYFRVSLNGYAYGTEKDANKKGIGFGLGNVQFIHPGELVGGGKVAGSDEFGDVTEYVAEEYTEAAETEGDLL